MQTKNRAPEFYEGQEAGRNGANDSDNPYPNGSDEAMDWFDGLSSVQDDNE